MEWWGEERGRWLEHQRETGWEGWREKTMETRWDEQREKKTAPSSAPQRENKTARRKDDLKGQGSGTQKEMWRG
jgi:hypothetical protein